MAGGPVANEGIQPVAQHAAVLDVFAPLSNAVDSGRARSIEGAQHEEAGKFGRERFAIYRLCAQAFLLTPS